MMKITSPDQTLASVSCPRILGPATTSLREELRASVRESLQAFRGSVSYTAFRILFLSMVEGRTSPEIGKLLGLTPGAVRVSHHLAAKKFRRFVARQPGLGDVLGVPPPPKKAPMKTTNRSTPRNPSAARERLQATISFSFPSPH